jgi:hypothetical protein
MPSELYTIDGDTVTVNYNAITRTTKNGITSLSYNGAVFDTITQKDLTGAGTKTDPYVIHSTRGFLYIQSHGMSGININDKYIELNCDVVLNDETFDKNGNPIGGDGVIYRWAPVYYGTKAFFNGNNHHVTGMYINDSTLTTQGLFGSVFNVMENLTVENFFVLGKSNLFAIANSANLARNLTTKNGTIRGKTTIGGILMSAGKAYDCTNYTDTIATSYDMGGCFRAVTYAENCKNYGTIKGMQNMGGIAGGATTLVNCVNYWRGYYGRKLAY